MTYPASPYIGSPGLIQLPSSTPLAPSALGSLYGYPSSAAVTAAIDGQYSTNLDPYYSTSTTANAAGTLARYYTATTPNLSQLIT